MRRVCKCAAGVWVKVEMRGEKLRNKKIGSPLFLRITQ
jgi:hypothetical protein